MFSGPPLLDACIDSPDSRLLNDSHAFQAVSDRFDNPLFIVQNATDPRVLEPLAGFHSAQIRDLQLTEARTIPEHLLSYWIRNAKHAIQILKNQPLMARHGPAVLSRIFDLPTNELDIRLIAELREVDPKDLEHAPQGWTNRIIQRALAKKSDPALDALESVFDALPDVTEQMIRRIVQVAERRRSRQMDVSYHPAAYPALLHPACPPDLRQRLLDGEFGFPHAILSHASTDAEILDAAWRHVGFKVSDHVLNHPNVSMETALSIVRTQVASPLYSWPPFFPGAAARPAIAVAYLDRWDTLDPKRFPSADHQKRAWDLASLLGHLFGQTTIVEGDPWLNLATSLAFRNLAYATFATPDDYKVLGHAIEHFRQMAERLHPTLDQNVVARCLQMPEKIFREQMSRCLVHISLQPGLIDRELPRWHAWANQIVSEHLNMTTSRGLRVVLSTMR